MACSPAAGNVSREGKKHACDTESNILPSNSSDIRKKCVMLDIGGASNAPRNQGYCIQC
jgi:hypothetical protein